MPNPDLGVEYNPLLLSMGLVEYNYEFEDFKLETIKRKIIGNRLNNQNNDSKLLDYFHVLNDNIYKETQNRKHDIFVEMIKLNINTTFFGKFNDHKVSLTKDTYTYHIEDDFFAVFNLMDDGKIQLANVSKANEEQKRCYVFGEFYHFISNSRENVEIDDKVLKMALI